MTNQTTKAALLALAIAALPGVALAHAKLEAANPAHGSTGPAPMVLHLDFSEAPDLAFTKVGITADGKVLAGGALSIDPADATVLLLTLPEALPPGAIRIEWKAVAADGHASKGEYNFTVAP